MQINSVLTNKFAANIKN